MLRFEVSEGDRPALPAIDLGDAVVVIGSGASARVRLPAEVGRAVHVRIDGRAWTLLADAAGGDLAWPACVDRSVMPRSSGSAYWGLGRWNARLWRS